MPENWTTLTSFTHYDVELPYKTELNVFGEKEPIYQFFYTFVSKQIPDPKEIIRVHVEDKLDCRGYESQCVYTSEYFHGYRALKYSFCGKFMGAYGGGVAYSFLRKGYIFYL